MHMRSVLAIARKDTIDILLNKSALFTLLTPIFLAALFLIVSSLIGTKTSNVLIYDPGHSGVDQVVSDFFTHHQVTHAASPEEVMAAFGPDGSHKSTSYTAGLVVPADFDAELRRGAHPRLSLYVNGDEVTQQDSHILQGAVASYAHMVANPQPALALTLTTINPPTSTPIGDINNMYTEVALLSSFLVGATIVPGLLIEEKEKKTIRMLMVSPATFTDIVLGKLLVGLIYQLFLSLLVLTIMKGYTGNIPLLLFFALLGSCFGLTLGLTAGSIFQSTSALGGFTGILSMVLIVSSIFVGPLGTLILDNPIAQIIKIIPTYYIAHGVYTALQSNSTFASTSIDISITITCIILFLVTSIWLLRRQASIVATI